MCDLHALDKWRIFIRKTYLFARSGNAPSQEEHCVTRQNGCEGEYKTFAIIKNQSRGSLSSSSDRDVNWRFLYHVGCSESNHNNLPTHLLIFMLCEVKEFVTLYVMNRGLLILGEQQIDYQLVTNRKYDPYCVGKRAKMCVV